MPPRRQSPKKVEEIIISEQASPSLIRITHAIPSAPNVDVILDGRRVLSNVSYKTSSEYLEVRPCLHLVQLNITGTSKTVLQGRVSVNQGESFTLIAHGDLAKNKISLLLLKDDNNCPVSGQARVRFVHASYNAPHVNIYANKTLNVFPNVGYGEAKVSNVPAGVYDLNVTPLNSSNIVLDVPNTEFKAGYVYTVIATGILGDIKYPLTVILNNDSQCMYIVL